MRTAPDGPKMQVRAGFDSYYKTSSWLPLQINLSLAEGQPPFEGWIEASFSNFADNTLRYRRSVQLAPPANRVLWLYLPSDTRNLFEAQVRLADREGNEIESQAVTVKPLNQGEFLLGVVSDDTSALNYLNGERLAQPYNRGSSLQQGRPNSVTTRPGTTTAVPARPAVRVAHLTAADLPPEGPGWDGLDGLALTDLTVQNLGDGRLNQPAMQQAAAGWLAQGRFLLVAGDSGLRKGGFLSRLAPVELKGAPQSLPDMQALSKITAEAEIPANLLVADGRAWPGAVNIAAGPDGRSLLSRRHYGLGTAWYVAAEMKSLGAPVGARLWRYALDNYEPRLAYAALQRQPADPTRRNVAEVNPSTRTSNLPESWIITAVLLAYVLTLGPLTYFILSRAGKRELGWIVAPALAVGLGLGIYLAGALTGGDPLVFSRLSVLTLGEDGAGQLEGGNTTIATVYSNTRVDFQLQAEEGVLVTALSRARGQLFGRQPDAPAEQLWQVQQGVGGGFGRVLLGLSDQRSFVAERERTPGAGEGIVARLTQRGDELDGTLENRTGSDWYDLSVWKTGSRIYNIPLLKAGETLTLNPVFAVRKNANLALALAAANSTATSNYSPDQQRLREIYINQKEAVLNTLLGPDGEALPKSDERVYLVAWKKSVNNFPLRIEGRSARTVDLTLLFEPLTLR